MTFLASLPPDGPARDAVILGAIATGNLDPVVWRKVRLDRVVLEVSADYLCIAGEHVPMSEHVAQAAVDSLDAVLPTPAIVDAIEAAAIILPLPTWAPPAGQSRAAQTSSAVFALCEERTRQLFEARSLSPEQLVAGHRKDVVLARYMPAGVVCIYGARWPDGRRLQPLYPQPGGNPGHALGYHDYSHGCRLVRADCLLDGRPAMVVDLLARGMLGGPVAKTRYPLAPAGGSAHGAEEPARPSTGGSHVAPQPAPSTPPTTGGAHPPPATPPKTLRRGDRDATPNGPVRELQRMLSLAGWHTRADGIFLDLTEAAVKAFQDAHGLAVDGIAGKDTMRELRAATADAPPDTEPAPAALTIPPILTSAQVDALFGRIEYVPAPHPKEPRAVRITNGWAANIVRITIPQLVGIEGGNGGVVACHRLIAEPLKSLFAAWQRAGLLGRIVSWHGCWNPRTMTGHPELLSNHAHGIAFDINADENPFHGPAARPGEPGSVWELLPLAVEHKFTWLAEHDPMHFSAFGI